MRVCVRVCTRRVGLQTLRSVRDYQLALLDVFIPALMPLKHVHHLAVSTTDGFTAPDQTQVNILKEISVRGYVLSGWA